MISRRRLVIALGAGALASPFGSFAQQPEKVWRVGFLSARSGPDKQIEAFQEQMKALGYVEGRNLSVVYRWAAGKEDRLREMAAELAQLKVDVLVASGTASVAAAKRATGSVPIVMSAVPDPVGNGLVASLARPGGNVTGVSSLSNEIAAKRLQLIREVVPKATRVALLAASAGAPSFPLFLEQLRPAAKQMGITLLVKRVGAAEEFAGVFVAMQRDRVQALLIHQSPFISDHRGRIAELALQHRLPAIEALREFVALGGLMSYAASGAELFRRAAFYVDRILKGAKPADLPVELPTKFELFINRKTARTLRLSIPQSLLVSADEVIE